MSVDELRALVALLDMCTKNDHPAERTGGCGAANRRYKVNYTKGRQIDRTLAELDRVVRFQNMFKQAGPRHTEYENRINSRLRLAAKTSLAAAKAVSDRQARGVAQPDLTRDASMPR